MRKPIIAGNWKMHKTAEEVLSFADYIKDDEIPSNVESVVCAPSIYLSSLTEKLKGTSVKVGAQNVYWEKAGAFTGEVSVPMLASLGIHYVIIGHSERRAYFNEINETVNKKLHAVLESTLLPIVCVGETLSEREEGKTQEVVSTQVTQAFKGVVAGDVQRTVIAYEPVWAIGTGKSASIHDAQEVIGSIREVIGQLFNSFVANHVRIQYGGSVTPENISQYLGQSEIDGALVGGASLDPSSFLRMLHAVGRTYSGGSV